MFSLSLYEDDLDLRSACSYSSESDDFRFDVDLEMDVGGDDDAEFPMMLPPSLPLSPKVDLETDIANCFEDLRPRASMQSTSSDDLSPSPSPMLKSKWSSSIIGSIREDHERRGPSAKLRLYFGGGGKRGSKKSKVPQITSYATKSPRGYGHGSHSSRESDVMIIGYGHGNGVRRRGSVTPTISYAGSNDSVLSRKPIPMEMFLRGGV